MKTFIFSALALGMMASCSNTEVEGIDKVDNGEPVAIQLSAGVEANVVAGVTRAPITGSDKFTAKVLGWEGTAAYTAEPSWSTTAGDIKATGTTANLILAAAQYYLADGTSTKMKAFYPSNAVINATNKNIYDFTNADGQTDVLMAAEVSGNKNSTSPVEFLFKHPLTQLKFKLVAGAGFPDNVTVSSIKVNGVQLPTGIDVSTDAVVYATAASLSIPGVTVDATAAVGDVDSNPVGSPIMVAPIAGGTFTVDIDTSHKSYTGINVTLAGVTGDVTGAGVAYVVTLTFKEKISASTDVTDWDTSGTGTGTVE